MSEREEQELTKLVSQMIVEIGEFRGELKDKVDNLHQEMSEKIDGLRVEVNEKIDGLRLEINEKIDGLRLEINEKIDGLRLEMNQRFDGLEARVGSLEKESARLREQIREIGGDLYQMNLSLRNHEKRLDKLEEQVV